MYGLVPLSATNAADGAVGRWRLIYKIPRTTTAMTAAPPMAPPTMAPTGVFEPPEEDEDGDGDEDEDEDEGEKAAVDAFRALAVEEVVEPINAPGLISGVSPVANALTESQSDEAVTSRRAH